MRGRSAPIQPISSISSNALHMPIRPTPPPVGYTITSGSFPPNCSHSSYPIVFLPSTRYGSFSVETSYQPSRSFCSATYLPQSEINPFSLTTFAPNAWHSITLAEGVSAGITITAGSPAAAAYAASAPPALPAVGAANAFAPSCLARDTAAVIPRALNDPVGFNPSSLMYRRFRPPSPLRPSFPPGPQGIDAPSRFACTKAVMPSPSETGGSFGKTSAYRHSVRARVFRFSSVSVAAARRRSYFASSGFPHVHRCCSNEASYFFPQAEHSSSTTFKALFITVKV